jgi:hypothetical protein
LQVSVTRKPNAAQLAILTGTRRTGIADGEQSKLAPLKMTKQQEIKGVALRGKCGDGKAACACTSAHIPDAPKQSMHYVEITDTVRVAVRMLEQ